MIRFRIDAATARLIIDGDQKMLFKVTGFKPPKMPSEIVTHLHRLHQRLLRQQQTIDTMLANANAAAAKVKR